MFIQGYSLEEPLALGMINNIIIQNRDKIKTVIFKETGTIPHESFLKISDALISITGLESIAFFDSQPQFKSYRILKDIVIREESNVLCCKNKKRILLIVLNRSSFDIDEYRHQVFGKERNKALCKGYE